MERLLNSLERRFGRYCLDNLTMVLVGAQAAAFVLSIAKPSFAAALVLDPEMVRAGQYWRLITYLFLPFSFSPLWAFLSLYVMYWLGTSLEQHWGSFKFQLYLIVGIVMTSAYAFAFNVPATNEYLIMSFFLAFATLWPRHEMLLFFILSVEVRWLALLDVVYLLYRIYELPGWAKLVPVMAIGNYLLFFGEQLVALLRGRPYVPSRARANTTFARPEPKPSKVRRCAICGISSEDDPDMDFRVCTCEKHGGQPTELCLPHARNH